MNQHEPGRNVYIGHRYVPLLMGEWDQSIAYEGLSIVTYQGASYTSKKRVPVGIDIDNEEFWTVTGNYNAQVEYYREDVVRHKNEINGKLDTHKNEVNGKLDTHKNKINGKLDTHKNEVNERVNKTDRQTYGERTFNLRYAPENVDMSEFIEQLVEDGYRRIIVPLGITLEKTLDLSHIREKSLILEGEGAADLNTYEANFYLNTGNIGIKVWNSHSVQFENISATSRNLNTPSTIGIVYTRETIEDQIGSMKTSSLSNVSIRMHSQPGANFGRGTIGVYADTNEIFTFHNTQLYADTTVIVTKSDILNICPENTYNTSCKDVIFTGFNFFQTYGGSALVLDGVINVSGNIAMADISDNPSEDVGAVEVMGYSSGINLVYDAEYFKIGLLVKGRIEKSDIYINTMHPKHAIVTSETDEDIVDVGFEKGYLISSTIKTTVSWGSDPNREHIYIKGNSQGLSGVMILGNDTIINERIASNIIYVTGNTKPRVETINGGVTASYTCLSPNTLSLNNRDIRFNYGEPSNVGEGGEGSVFFNTFITGNTGYPFAYVKTGEDTFEGLGQIGMRSTPPETATPRQLGEIILDGQRNVWIATGTETGEFTQLSGV